MDRELREGSKGLVRWFKSIPDSFEVSREGCEGVVRCAKSVVCLLDIRRSRPWP